MDEAQKVNDKYTLQEVLTAIKGSSGIKATIQRKLGCSRKTVDSYLNRYVTAQQAYDEEIDKVGDVAESIIIEDMVVRKSVETAKWYAVKKLGHRGYKEQVEQKHSGSVDVLVKGYVGITPDDWDKEQDSTDSNL